MQSDFPITTQRYIAYFDIMGFKDFIYTNDHKTVGNRMNDLFTIIEPIANDAETKIKSGKIPNPNPNGDVENGIVLPVFFSDSILIISRGDSASDANKTLFASTWFLKGCIKMGIPVKGVLSFGLFTADFARSIFYGRPLVDAYLLHDELQCYTAVLHHTFDKRLCELGASGFCHALKFGNVPLKTGAVTHQYIDWSTQLNKGESSIKLLKQFYYSSSGAIRKYIDNTNMLIRTPNQQSKKK